MSSNVYILTNSEHAFFFQFLPLQSIWRGSRFAHSDRGNRSHAHIDEDRSIQRTCAELLRTTNRFCGPKNIPEPAYFLRTTSTSNASFTMLTGSRWERIEGTVKCHLLHTKSVPRTASSLKIIKFKGCMQPHLGSPYFHPLFLK